MPSDAPGFWQRVRPKRPRDWLIASLSLLLGVPIIVGIVVGTVTEQPADATPSTTAAPPATTSAPTTTERVLTDKQTAAIEGLLDD